MARTLITNRRPPAATPDWSGWATMLGLQRAAPSMAYSLVNVAPSSKSPRPGEHAVRIHPIGELVGVVPEGLVEVAVPAREPGDDIVEGALHLVLVQRQDALQHRRDT